MQNENDDFHFLSIRERPNNTPTDKIYLSLLASEKETLLLPSTLPTQKGKGFTFQQFIPIASTL
jgi:hypothetical protein